MERFSTLMLLAFLAFVAVAGCSKGAHTTSNTTTEQSSAAPEAGAATPATTASATETTSPQENASMSASPAGVPTLQVAFIDINGNDAQQAIADEAALGILDTSSGAFKPDSTISRAQFVRWLVKANNIYFKDNPGKRIRLAHNGQQFADVSPNNPDFVYIQGLANAGFVIGVDNNHFAPDRTLTREELIGIKGPMDEGGAIKADVSMSKFDLKGFTDVDKISTRYLAAIDEDGSVRTTQNRARIWGPQKTLHPQMPVTRSEAAIAIWEVADGSAPVALGRTAPPAPKP